MWEVEGGNVMASVVRWDLSCSASSPLFEMSLAIRQPVQRRDYVICVENVDSQAFIDANVGWYHSERLRCPFKYVPVVENAPHVFDVGILSLPFDCSSLEISVRTWRSNATHASRVFDALLLTVMDNSNIKKTRVIEGICEEA